MEVLLLFKGNSVVIALLELLYTYLSLHFFYKISKEKFSIYKSLIFIFSNFISFVVCNATFNYIIGLFCSIIISVILLKVLLNLSFYNLLSYYSIDGFIILNLIYIFFNILHIFINVDFKLDIACIPLLYVFLIICKIILNTVLSLFFKHFNNNALAITSINKNYLLLIASSVFNLSLCFSAIYFFYNFILNHTLAIFLTNLYFFISYILIYMICKQTYTKLEFDNLKLTNQTISNLYDETRAFKHDFQNIIQAIGGYIYINDFDGLKTYYKQIFNDCKSKNNLAKLNSDLINNPAIYNVLANKYFLADSNNIQFNLDVMLDLSKLNVKIYEFTRILGILLDNAIEASKECSQKSINLTFKEENNRQIILIENTYQNKHISLEQIYEKNFTTKPHNTGLGLWEVRRILNKTQNLNLYTSKNEEYFSQQLEIYSC